ncbi:MAG: hypothetical protein FJY98_01285 [Candidatus Liptonbacteria bacterium]|nr:hypothetical protein [Candidatus Liptonbacteria bacterium]
MIFKRAGVVGIVGAAAFLLGSGASYLFAQTTAGWTAPTATPPGGNTEAPVNVGPFLQHKNGGLSVGGNGQPLNASGTLSVVGDTKLGKDLEVIGRVKVGQSLIAPIISAGPLSPEAPLSSVALTVGGKVQIRGGNPQSGYVLTATGTDGTTEWKAAPITKIVPGSNVTVSPASGMGEVTINAIGGVTKLRAGSNISIDQETGEVTVSASFSDNTPSWVNNIPYPPGGGKILVSNSEGSASWQDPLSLPELRPRAATGTVCGGGTDGAGQGLGSLPTVWGSCASQRTPNCVNATYQRVGGSGFICVR